MTEETKWYLASYPLVYPPEYETHFGDILREIETLRRNEHV